MIRSSSSRRPFARSAACLPLVLLLVGGGCGPKHIAPFTPRQRVYTAGSYAQRSPDSRPANGSLWSDAMGGYLTDNRAVRVGDFVSIRIDESADASGAASTQLKQDSSANVGTSSFFGLLPALKKAYPDIDPTKLFDYASKSNFTGEGGTTRKGQLKGTVAVRVTKEMPNGDLFIEGTKVVLINNEEYHLYLSGLIRVADIAMDNSIESSKVADAQIEFTGNGDIADQTRKGWLARFLDWINPF